MPTSARRSPTSSTAAASARRSTWPATASARAVPLLRPAAAGRGRGAARSLYAHLAPVANRWAELLGEDDRFPETHGELLDRCAEAGQRRPTPLILRYGPGDWNALHQDLYGDVYFPFQAVTVLDEPGVDFEGGEFVLMEQRPRAQSRAHVAHAAARRLRPVPDAPAAAARQPGHYRVGLRHGVSTVTRGRRTALGIVFHDAA